MATIFPIDFDPNDPNQIARWVLIFPYLQWDPSTGGFPVLSYRVTAKVTREVTKHDCQILGILGWGGFGVVFRSIHPTLGPLAIKIPRFRLTDSNGQFPDTDKEQDLADSLEAFAQGLSFPIGETTKLAFERKRSQRVKEELNDRTGGLNAEIALRFQRECEVLQRIDHPHVVKILHVGNLGINDRNGNWKSLSSCISLQFLDGTKASKAIRAQRRADLEGDLVTILTFAKQIALGAAAVHDTGSPHRDLSWGNMLVESATGKAVIVDLGNVMGDTGNLSFNINFLNDPTMPLVRVFGWPGFIAPEQRNGLPEKASDQFSLGVSLYHWFTGQFPFSIYTYAPNTPNGPTPIHVHCSSLAATWRLDSQQALKDICAAVMKCLDDHAIERHESMRDLAATLESILIDLEQSTFAPLTRAEVTPVGHFLDDAVAIKMSDPVDQQATASQILTAFARFCRLLIYKTIDELKECVTEYVDESVDLKSVGRKYEGLVKRVEITLRRMKEMLREVRIGLQATKGINPARQFGGELQERIQTTINSVSKLHEDASRRVMNPAMKLMKERRDDDASGGKTTEKEWAREYLDLLEKVRHFQSELGDFDFSLAVYVLQLRKLILGP